MNANALCDHAMATGALPPPVPSPRARQRRLGLQAVFWAGCCVALFGAVDWDSLRLVISGSVSSGTYTSVELGEILVIAGLFLMLVAHLTLIRVRTGVFTD